VLLYPQLETKDKLKIKHLLTLANNEKPIDEISALKIASGSNV
jgi:hypothetical protein